MARAIAFLLGVLLGCEASRPERALRSVTPSLLPEAPECVATEYPIAFVSTRGTSVNLRELYVMDLEGNTRQIGRGPTFSPVWSPEGRSLAFRHRVRDRSVTDAGRPLTLNEVVLSAADGTVNVALTAPERAEFDLDAIAAPDGPTWSPDGQTLAYASAEGASGYRIWLVPRAGGPGRRLFPELDQPHFFPSWSRANPSSLAYVWERDGVEDLWLVDLAHLDRLENLSRGRVLSPKWPRWSPDGSWLAFAALDPLPRAEDGGDFEVYRLDLASGEIEQLTRNRVQDLHPAWAPDGQSLLVARGVPAEDAATVPLDSLALDLWLVPLADPEAAVQVTNVGWLNCAPDWFWAEACTDQQ
jgi:Tol biopolymer transport system component